ncbi:MAG: aminotransferase class I and II [Polyangiaceae bacterium]|nr:aminotransferase class I and II [Polyangiaceae bacterium]
MIRLVHASRYVLPLREGGSVPALVEADDLGMYVVKLRGAGQGPKALIAELIAGELARAAGLSVPEIVFVEVARALADSEPDPEIAEPLEKSAGVNLGLDYLPGSITFDPVADSPPSPELASRVVLFDAFVANVDRTPRNPNLLSWHAGLWLIDHGASLYFHHGWSPDDPLEGSRDPFAEVRDHVLLRAATALEAAADHLARTFSDELFARVVGLVPPAWLDGDRSFPSHDAQRAAYVGWLRARRDAIPLLLEEATRVRSGRV